jgi:cyclase
MVFDDKLRRAHMTLCTIILIAAGILNSGNLALAAEPIWDANTVELSSERLSEGVFYFHAKNAQSLKETGGAAATSGGFIAGSKGVLLIETMLNERLFRQAATLIKTHASGEIIYAVNTSAHGDHSFGNIYLSQSTRIIQHQHTAQYIANHLEDDKKFMIQNFGAGRGIESIQGRSADIIIPSDGKISLDLGGIVVDIMDFGFAQTGGDLFIWEPASKVLWTGNPVIASKPAIPWLLDGNVAATLATLKKVYAFLPSDARIIPGHSVKIGKEDLKWHLDYLETLQKTVLAEIALGATEKDISSRVPMPEFSGYAIYGWVHSGVNVPAAYKEFKKPLPQERIGK